MAYPTETPTLEKLELTSKQDLILLLHKALLRIEALEYETTRKRMPYKWVNKSAHRYGVILNGIEAKG